MRTKSMQLSVFAVAALAIVAVAAVMLLFGGAPAQAENTQPQNEPVKIGDPHQHEPRACDPNPAEVVSEGHIAVFEVYWDATKKLLVNNPCPPKVNVKVHQNKDEFGNKVGDPTYTVTRVKSDIHVDSTIFHVPSSYEETLVTTGDVLWNTSANKYPFLAENGNQTAWIVAECPHDRPPEAGQLCIGFSSWLLHQDDWEVIGFQFETLRQPGLRPDDRGHAFVFHTIGDDDFPQGESHPIWDTSDPDANEIVVEGGSYRHPNWAFTKAGTYEFSVQVKAQPAEKSDGSNPISSDDAVTSVARTYTFHVGDFADLSVEVEARESDTGTPPLEPGDEVTITVTAENAGPDAANHTNVDVTLPEGLTYSSHSPTTDTFADSDGDGIRTWSVGTLASDASETLEIRATVDPNTRGQALTISAEIHATETIGSSTVVELDPHTHDNTAEATVTPAEIANVDPMGQLFLSVAENSVSTDTQKVLVGGFLVYDPDSDVLYPDGNGEGSENFTYSMSSQASDGTALPDGVKRILIEVAENVELDYEHQNSFTIVVGVSDRENHLGNTDDEIDHKVRLSIMLTDVSDGFTRVVAENSPGGTDVGAVIPVTLGDGSGTPSYRLSGTGSDKFTVAAATDGAQISVAQGAILNHEDDSSFNLTLHASDDNSNSEDIAVRIVVEDVLDEQLTVTLTSDVTTQTVGQRVNFTAVVTNSPVASDQLQYRWSKQNVGGGNAFSENTHVLTHSETYNQAVEREYEFAAWYLNDQGENAPRATDTVVITWTAASN